MPILKTGLEITENMKDLKIVGFLRWFVLLWHSTFHDTCLLHTHVFTILVGVNVPDQLPQISLVLRLQLAGHSLRQSLLSSHLWCCQSNSAEVFLSFCFEHPSPSLFLPCACFYLLITLHVPTILTSGLYVSHVLLIYFLDCSLFCPALWLHICIYPSYHPNFLTTCPVPPRFLCSSTPIPLI